MRLHDILLTICSSSCSECIEASYDNYHYAVCICTHTYMHSCILTYIHTYIYPYNEYIHTYIHTYILVSSCLAPENSKDTQNGRR